MTALYQASSLKRRRRTRAQIEQLERQIVEIVARDRPVSIRNVFYQLTNPRLPEVIEKSDRGYNQVQARLTKLRRARRVPYSSISDMSRRGYFVDTFDGAADFLRRVKGLYRSDLWRQAEYYVEVWVESRSIAGIIQDDCEELAVSLYPCGGFPSITLAYQAAEFINGARQGRPVAIFYIGDYDPAGVLIDVALERELREHLSPGTVLEFNRIGITAEQVEAYDLPTKARKSADRRSLHLETTVEAEALPASILRTILREAVESLLPVDALAVAKAAEHSERQHIERMAQFMEARP